MRATHYFVVLLTCAQLLQTNLAPACREQHTCMRGLENILPVLPTVAEGLLERRCFSVLVLGLAHLFVSSPALVFPLYKLRLCFHLPQFCLFPFSSSVFIPYFTHLWSAVSCPFCVLPTIFPTYMRLFPKTIHSPCHTVLFCRLLTIITFAACSPLPFTTTSH